MEDERLQPTLIEYASVCTVQRRDMRRVAFFQAIRRVVHKRTLPPAGRARNAAPDSGQTASSVVPRSGVITIPRATQRGR